MASKQNYLVFKTDGKVEKLVTDGEIPLEVAKEIVGGYIEVVPLDQNLDLILIVNEEGLILNLPSNPWFQGIAGNVIVAKSKPPDMLGLSKDDMNIILATIQLLRNEVKQGKSNSYEA